MKKTAPLFLFLLGAACMPKAAPPPLALVPNQVELAKKKDANVTEEQLENGRKVFVGKCGECHDHPDLTSVRLSKWPAILKDMVEKGDFEKDTVAVAELNTFVLTAAEAAGAQP
ncbi:MAG: hypothetical protein JNK82_17895 [Myxococcaceae bacterium]|nr:hypothetical protein [Myxococcaceae bacterium]